MGRIEAFDPATLAETLAYLSQRPYENVYVSWLIATGQHARGEVALWREADGSIGGLCYFGAQLVPCADGVAAIDAFAARTRGSRPARMIVGPRRDVDRFWTSARAWYPAPTGVRSSQPLYALAPATLRTFDADPLGDVGLATADELDELVPHAAQMIAGEIGGDPRRASTEFRNRCARIVAAGWWWRYRVDGRLVFTCHIGSASDATAQIQGVWAPPETRGAGHATRGLAAICAALLRTRPTLSLYVNDFNTPAIALYERVGFERVGEFATLLFA